MSTDRWINAPTVEVIESYAAGWCWRCHACDLTTVGLTEQDAARQAREHEVDIPHRLAVRRDS